MRSFLDFLVLLVLSLPSQYHVSSESLLSRNLDYKRKQLEAICGVDAAKHLLGYASFHEDVLQMKLPPRYLVAVAAESGFADRLTGIISLFWLSFFSKHAFQIGIYEKMPSFSDAYDPVFINWTRSSFVPLYEAPLLLSYYGNQRYINITRRYDPKLVNTSIYHLEFLIHQYQASRLLYRVGNLFSYPWSHTRKGESHVYASSTRGNLHYLHHNPRMREFLIKDLKISAETMFRCGYHFLFQPNSQVEAIMRHKWKNSDVLFRASSLSKYLGRSQSIGENEYVSMISPHRRLPSQPRGIGSDMIHSPVLARIGIGIRAGDATFNPEYDKKLTFEKYLKFIQCARNVEKSIPQEILKFHHRNQPYLYKLFQKSKSTVSSSTKWLFLSESVRLRELMSSNYSEKKLIIDPGTYYHHGDCQEKTYGGCVSDNLRKSIQHAVAQFTLFSLCDIHVLGDSGFHRLSAMLSKSPHHIYLHGLQCSFNTTKTWIELSKIGCNT